MNNKKEVIKLWSILLVGTTIFNIVLCIFLFKLNMSWLTIALICSIWWNFIAFAFWIASFTTKYKKLAIANNQIEIYAGFVNHFLKVNGEMKDEYKAGITFSPIKLSCLIKENKLEVTISTSNHIVVKFNNELIK